MPRLAWSGQRLQRLETRTFGAQQNRLIAVFTSIRSRRVPSRRSRISGLWMISNRRLRSAPPRRRRKKGRCGCSSVGASAMRRRRSCRRRQGSRRCSDRQEAQAALYRRLAGRTRQHAAPPGSRQGVRQADPQAQPARLPRIVACRRRIPASTRTTPTPRSVMRFLRFVGCLISRVRSGGAKLRTQPATHFRDRMIYLGHAAGANDEGVLTSGDWSQKYVVASRARAKPEFKRFPRRGARLCRSRRRSGADRTGRPRADSPVGRSIPLRCRRAKRPGRTPAADATATCPDQRYCRCG
jgi:hypothetical protein